MSHKNYSKHFENETVTETIVEEPVVIESTAELPEVPTQGYLSVEDVTTEEVTLGEVTTEVVEVESVEEPKKTELIGVVSGCAKLNVRAEASKDSDIVTVISVGTELTIEDTEDDFYKVCTLDNKTGYCMKKFIVIK